MVVHVHELGDHGEVVALGDVVAGFVGAGGGLVSDLGKRVMNSDSGRGKR